MSEQPSSGYRREAARQGTGVLVASTCKYGGFRIVGNASDIGEDERDHRDKCNKERRPRAVPARR